MHHSPEGNTLTFELPLAGKSIVNSLHVNSQGAGNSKEDLAASQK